MKDTYYLIQSRIEPYNDDEAMLKVIQCADLHGVAQNMLTHGMYVTDVGSTVLVIRGENIDILEVEKVLAPIRALREIQSREQQAREHEERERSEYERLKAKFEPDEEVAE